MKKTGPHIENTGASGWTKQNETQSGIALVFRIKIHAPELNYKSDEQPIRIDGTPSARLNYRKTTGKFHFFNVQKSYILIQCSVSFFVK